MVKIREDMSSMTEYDDPDEILYSVFVNGKRILSFQTESVEPVLCSPNTLASNGDKVCLGWGANEGENWIERQDESLLISRGNLSYGLAGETIDERNFLAEIPLSEWYELVVRFSQFSKDTAHGGRKI